MLPQPCKLFYLPARPHTLGCTRHTKVGTRDHRPSPAPVPISFQRERGAGGAALLPTPALKGHPGKGANLLPQAPPTSPPKAPVPGSLFFAGFNPRSVLNLLEQTKLWVSKPYKQDQLRFRGISILSPFLCELGLLSPLLWA